MNGCMLLVCKMTDIVEKEKKKRRHEMSCCMNMVRVAVCGSAKHTTANRTVKWKERPVYHKHTNICPWKSEPIFQCTRRVFFFIKRIKTHLLIYHSQRTQLSSWQVSLTCFTHLITTCLQAPVMNEPRRAAYAHTITNLKILDTSLQSGLKKKKKIKKNTQTL